MAFVIKDWKDYQHYSQRRPPWIKLYGKLLDNAEFMAMPEAAQAQLVKLWILASQMGHPLTSDVKTLAGKIGAKGRFHLPLFISLGFVSVATEGKDVLASEHENASKMLAKSDDNAIASRARTRARDRDQSSENRTTPSVITREDLPEELRSGISEVDQGFVCDLLNRVAFRDPWIAEMQGALHGIHYPTITGTQLGLAVRQFMGNLSTETPNMQYFRGHINRAARGEKAPPDYKSRGKPDKKRIDDGNYDASGNDDALAKLERQGAA